MEPQLQLKQVSRADVSRMIDWLNNRIVLDSWYGSDEEGQPLHIGYSPAEMIKASERKWKTVFHGETRKIFSVYDAMEGHIGEAQMVIEPPLHEAQLFMLIGRQDLWLHHYGTIALGHLLDICFLNYKLHRVWVDVPIYNDHAIHICQRLGFLLEGHLRSTHQKDNKWYDSVIMGMLENEFQRRRQNVASSSLPKSSKPVK